MERMITGALCALALAACGQMTSQPEQLTSGIELANMDTSVRPQDDFFRYVNGSWLETTEMPVMDMALALGYTDTSNFTRAFRRRTGIPPQRYRATIRGE